MMFSGIQSPSCTSQNTPVIKQHKTACRVVVHTSEQLDIPLFCKDEIISKLKASQIQMFFPIATSFILIQVAKHSPSQGSGN
jgi:hypothetical protein